MSDPDQPCQLSVSGGRVAVVDLDVWEWARRRSWSLSNGYPATRCGGELRRLHRCVLNPPPPLEIDHINGNRLDNRRSNLRIVSRAENLRGHWHNHPDRGVSWSKRAKKWRAYITIDRRQIHLGLFETKEEARDARQAGEQQYWV